jgi:ribosome recycling factor
MALVDDAKLKMEKTLENFKGELKNLRTNQANPGMVEGIMVDAYGSVQKLKAVATLSTTPDKRNILITPFDQTTKGAISQAILRANLNLQPIVDGNMVRVPVPPMDGTTRKETVKVGYKKAEDAKIAIRNIRHDVKKNLDRKQKEGEIPENQVKGLVKKLDEVTKQSCDEIDKLCAQKEKDIMAF